MAREQFAVVTGTDQSKYTGKWACVLDLCDKNGVAASATSAHIFDDAIEAYEAGIRACVKLEKTGVFPSMCVPF